MINLQWVCCRELSNFFFFALHLDSWNVFAPSGIPDTPWSQEASSLPLPPSQCLPSVFIAHWVHKFPRYYSRFVFDLLLLALLSIRQQGTDITLGFSFSASYSSRFVFDLFLLALLSTRQQGTDITLGFSFSASGGWGTTQLQLPLLPYFSRTFRHICDSEVVVCQFNSMAFAIQR